MPNPFLNAPPFKNRKAVIDRDVVTGTEVGSGEDAKYALDVAILANFPDLPANYELKTISNKEELPSNSETTVVEYTVPEGKAFYLVMVQANGSNFGRFQVLIDDAFLAEKNTWWSKFDADFYFTQGLGAKIVPAGGNIKLSALHNRPYVGDFSGVIIGIEKTI